MSGNILEINDKNFESEVLKSDIPVLVDFWAPWCGPCRSIAPIIEELANVYLGKIKIGKCNVDDNQLVAAQYGIRSIPTLKFFKNGNIVNELVGMAPKPTLEKALNSLL
ncbi:MAG: thioredoxin [Desulfobacterales bacterium]|nr:thioredoxin [Desulfobacterales bacterium]MBF0397912.1 thioredoxin [Desulfobacterales bacterium]